MARLVGKNAAEVRRVAERATDVGAELEQDEAGGEGDCRASRGAARGARDVQGIVGGAVDLVVALEIAKDQRQVCLAQDDRAGGLGPTMGMAIPVRREA